MSNRHSYTDIAASLDEEFAFLSSSKFSSLKLQKGESAIWRTLPAQLGSRKKWYVRVARHWIGKKPIVCVRGTSPDLGGDPTGHCPVCAVISDFSNGPAKSVAGKMEGWAKWLTYEFVWEHYNAKRVKYPRTEAEMYIPNEVWLSREAFKEYLDLWNESLKRIPGVGFLHPIDGWDFKVTVDERNGMRFYPQDPQAIAANIDEDAAYKLIDDAMAQVKLPDIGIPTEQELDAAVAKAREILEAADRPAARGGRTRSAVDSGEEVGEGEPEFQEPRTARAAPVAQPARAPAAAPARTPASTFSARPAPAASPARPAATPTAVARPAAPGARPLTPPPAARPAAPVRTAPPAVTPARTYVPEATAPDAHDEPPPNLPVQGASSGVTAVDEAAVDEEFPEESRDAAPAADTAAQPEEAAAVEPAPARVPLPPARPANALSTSMRAALANRTPRT